MVGGVTFVVSRHMCCGENGGEAILRLAATHVTVTSRLRIVRARTLRAY
jgi:hypothetical protein